MKVVIVQMLDDIDSSLIVDGDGGTMQFGLDGITYDIDLTQEHSVELRALLAPYVAAGRRRGKAAPAKSNKGELTAIRAWANQNGVEVSDRGRISESVRAAYNARS